MSGKKDESKTHGKDVYAIEIHTEGTEKTVVKALVQCSFCRNGDPATVDAKNGKILRIKSFHYDKKYTKKQINPWEIEKNGKVLEPLMKS